MLSVPTKWHRNAMTVINVVEIMTSLRMYSPVFRISTNPFVAELNAMIPSIPRRFFAGGIPSVPQILTIMVDVVRL